MIMRCIALCTALGLALAAPVPAPARSAAPLFAASDPLPLTIKAPLNSLIRNRNIKTAIPGTLIDPTGQSLSISLTLRGITRRMSDICDFPPLRVDFTAPPPAGSVFAGQKRLKLVTHCKNSPSFQQNVLLEYAAYRMYNVLTPHSFQVRLANISYQDETGRPIIARIGYFMEDLKDVAKRNGLPQTHAGIRIPAADLSPADAGRYAMFQHMIANHDWSMQAGPPGEECCHNAKLIGLQAPLTVVPVPYDFDFSGFVDAPYATPPDILNIDSVRDRKYRGYCGHNAYALQAAQQMRTMEPQMLAALSSVPGLDERTRGKATNFLDGFFAMIGSDADVQAKILRYCFG